jgi:hypothetical protein
VQDRTSLYACVAAAMASMTLSFLLHSPWSIPNLYSDIHAFWARSWVQDGQIPYLHAFFEYPPISGFLIYVSRIIGRNYDGYYATFGIMCIAAAGLLAWSCWRISKALNSRLNPLYFLLPSMIIYGVYSFDLFHALFIALSLQMFLEGRKSSSAIMLSLAIATKLVSVVLLPVYIIELRSLRPTLKYLALVSVSLGVIGVPLALLNFNYFIQFYQYFKTYGLEDAWYVWIFQNPASWGYAKIFGLALMALLLLETYTLKISLVPKLYLALVAFVIGTYVYAPQFNLMLIPIIAVLGIESPSLFFWEVFNAAIILTWFGVSDPTAAGTLPQLMSLLRFGALVWLSSSVLGKYGVHPMASFRRYIRQGYTVLKVAKIKRA